MPAFKGRVLSVCDRTGNMLKPWAEDGWECIALDVQHAGDEVRDGVRYVEGDVRTYQPPPCGVVFGFPPCTHFAVSGARWWASKGPAALAEGLELVFATVRIIAASGAPVWCVENPVGRLAEWWRAPDYTFNPCDFGGYLDPPGDAYTKRTCLWASRGFVMPVPRPVDPVEGSKMHRIPPGPERMNLRSETPMGFARAVWTANKDGGRRELLARPMAPAAEQGDLLGGW